MPITRAEAARLSRRTGMKINQFTWENKGILTLMNNDLTKACMFLLTDSSEKYAEGICSVYDIRPRGCQIYPFVLDENDNAIIDSSCTFRDEFPKPFEDDTISLLSLEEKLMQGE
tara:strand:+ start:174 stop:518 length:345 start_codon:yes stop_codon:yes gene_type:complete